MEIDEEEFNKIRGKHIGMIFQDPLSALNPLMKIENQIEEKRSTHRLQTLSPKREDDHHCCRSTHR